MAAIGFCAQRGIVSDDTSGGSALAGGLGAGLGIIWKFALGFSGTGLIVDVLFIAIGVGLTFGALHYGKRIRRLRAEADANPETFE